MNQKAVVGVAVGVSAAALGAAGVLLWPQGQPEPVPVPEVAVVEPARPSTPPPQIRVPEAASNTASFNPGDRFDPNAMFADFESRLAKFDTDGDGSLSDEERRAMMENMRREWESRMDKNGDGVVDENERLDAMLESPRGRRMIERFDANGDGMLDDAERQAILDDMAAREAERQQRRVERYDTDGDGVLSEAEERAAQEQEAARQRDRFNRFAQEFDEDGDGDLNADERYNAFQTMRDRREYDQFIRRYDTDGDRQITMTDFTEFLANYQAQYPSADVNGDGVVDQLDVTAFRDWMSRTDRP